MVRWWNLYGQATIWLFLTLLNFRGRRLRLPTGDTGQLGGDVLIDPGGMVRLAHVAESQADRPTVDSLLDCMRRHRAETSENHSGNLPDGAQ